ncbi:MAG: hypothetical protein ACJ788_25805 [Ktedonobacteraceae bacterium]
MVELASAVSSGRACLCQFPSCLDHAPAGFDHLPSCLDHAPSCIVSRRRTVHRLSLCLLLSMVILLLGGGVALLWEYQQGSIAGQAAGDVSVVGPPTVSAATVDAIFARLGSPMVGTGKVVEQASRQTNIDDAFALGVWWTETNDGAAGVGRADRNPGSVRGSVGYPSAFDGYTIYPSYTAAIQYWFSMMRNNYVVGRGLSTVYTIARPYVGTSSSPLWASKVINLMYRYRGMAPPPPVVTPKPKPTSIASVLLKSRAGTGTGTHTSIGLTQEAPRQPAIPKTIRAPQVAATAALPRPTEFAIVFFGLLAALAIALYSLTFNLKTSGTVTSPDTVGAPLAGALAPLMASLPRSSAPVTDQLVGMTGELYLPVEPVGATLAVALPGVPQLDFPGSTTQTDALVLPRRLVLLPAHTGAAASKTAVDSGTAKRAVGLLSRYKDEGYLSPRQGSRKGMSSPPGRPQGSPLLYMKEPGKRTHVW